MGAPGSTPGVEDGDGWQRNKDPPRCRCSLVTKTVMMAPLPPQAGWFEEVHLVTKTVMMAPLPPQAGWFEEVQRFRGEIIMPTSLVVLAKRAHALMVLFLNFSLERACTHKYKLN